MSQPRDEIVEEIREHRASILREANGDVRELVRQLQTRAATRGLKEVTLAPRKPSDDDRAA